MSPDLKINYSQFKAQIDSLEKLQKEINAYEIKDGLRVKHNSGQMITKMKEMTDNMNAIKSATETLIKRTKKYMENFYSSAYEFDKHHSEKMNACL